MTTTPELAIRLRRAAFNAALAGGDLNAIGPILAPDAMLIAGTDSALIAGRKAQLIAWRREFSVADRTVYTRTPDEIIPSAVEPIALEHGRWRGVSATTGESVAHGAYTAKWRRIGADWMIEGELYLTLG